MNTLISFLNQTGQSFVTFHSTMWIQSSILILILLLLDRLFRKHVRAVVRYWIWLLVLIKLILPVTLTSPVSIGRLIPTTEPTLSSPSSSNAPVVMSQPSAPIASPSDIVLTANPPATLSPALAKTSNPAINQTPPLTDHLITDNRSQATSLTWQGITLLAWWTTAVVMLLILGQRLWRLKQLLRFSNTAQQPHRNLLDQAQQQIGIVQSIQLKIIPMAGSPSVVGLWHPTILLPQDMLAELNESHLRNIFLHELAHIKRGDLWVSLCQTLIQIAYCYNPLLWIANAVIRNIREQAVDETVLVTLGEQADDYPRTLLDISKLSFKRPALSLHLIGVVESKKALFERIKYIATRPIPHSAKLGLTGLATLLLLGLTLIPMARAEKSANKNPDSQELNSVYGIVVDTLGRPRPSALLAPDGTNIWYGQESQAGGKFILRDISDEQRTETWLAFSQGSKLMALFQLQEGTTEKPLQVTLNLSEGEVAGRVVGPDGRGMSGRKVKLTVQNQEGLVHTLDYQPKTDTYGYYEGGLIPCGNGVTITASLGDANEAEQDYQTSPWPLRDNQIFAELPLLLVASEKKQPDYDRNINDDGSLLCSGRAVDDKGQPIAGVKVNLSYRMPGYMSIHGRDSVTDHEGRWQRRIPKDHSNLNIELSHREYYCQSSGKPSLEELQNGTYQMTMAKGLALTGTVQDATGQSISNALVVAGDFHGWTASPENRIIEGTGTARTDNNGHFEVRSLSPGIRTVLVVSADHAPTAFVTLIRPDMEPCQVQLGKGQSYYGKVVDPNGTPIEGVTIGLDAWKLGTKQHRYSCLAQTDDQGQFELAHLPGTGSISCYMSKKGYKGFHRDITVGKAEPEEITMFKPPVFHGKVIDAKTHEPITSFKLTSGIRWKSGENADWSRYYNKTVKSQDGSYDYQWSGYSISMPFTGECLLKIEVPGYYPEIASPITLGQPSRVDTIYLKKGKGATGKVVDAEGHPVDQAQVAWVSPREKAYIEEGKLSSIRFTQQTDTVTTTQADGRFELPPTQKQGTIVALHDRGYAIMASTEFNPEHAITLTPWAVVQGSVINSNSSDNTIEMSLGYVTSMAQDEASPVIWRGNYFEVSGKSFTYSHVPAVPLSLGQLLRGEKHNAQFWTANPGQTYEVMIDTKGHIAMGRINQPPNTDFSKSRQIHVAAFKVEPLTNVPPNILSIEKSSFQWLWQDKATAYPQSKTFSPRFIPIIQEDGSFTISGLTPGLYDLITNIHAPLGENASCGRGPLQAVDVTRFEVTSDQQAIQLPDINPSAVTYPEAGDMAPLFSVRTLDGQALHLNNLRGKIVLLDFWAPWCSPCVAEIPELQKIHEQFGNHPNFKMIGLSVDWDVERLEKFLKDKPLPWTQANIGKMGQSIVTQTYGIGNIPTKIIIGPDGKILAKNPTTETLLNIIKTNLSQHP